jgi:type VI secretion system ImpM family protein
MASVDTAQRTLAASLFGKIPGALDFVRTQPASRTAVALDAWLQASNQALASAALGWPRQRVRFLFAPLDTPGMLLGTLAPSRDRAGRKFPIAVFRELEHPAQPVATKQLTSARMFFAHLELTLDRLATASKEEARALVAALSEAMEEDDDADPQSPPQLDDIARAAFAARVLGAEPRILQDAVRELRDRLAPRSTARSTQTVDLPVHSESDVCTWLQLLERAGDCPLSLLWIDQGLDSRLLASVGTPSERALSWLTQPQARSPALFLLRDQPQDSLSRSRANEEAQSVGSHQVAATDE